MTVRLSQATDYLSLTDAATLAAIDGLAHGFAMWVQPDESIGPGEALESFLGVLFLRGESAEARLSRGSGSWVVTVQDPATATFADEDAGNMGLMIPAGIPTPIILFITIDEPAEEDGFTAELWIGGVLAATAVLSGHTPDDTPAALTEIRIGNAGSGSNPFVGLISELAILTGSAPTIDEVDQHVSGVRADAIWDLTKLVYYNRLRTAADLTSPQVGTAALSAEGEAAFDEDDPTIVGDPTGAFALYESDGTTPIASGSAVSLGAFDPEDEVSLSLVVKNEGVSNIDFATSSPSLSGSHFQIKTPHADPLAAGSDSFEIELADNETPGPRSTTITWSFDGDPDRSTYSLTVTATITGEVERQDEVPPAVLLPMFLS